jgi:hypothetical protein
LREGFGFGKEGKGKSGGGLGKKAPDKWVPHARETKERRARLGQQAAVWARPTQKMAGAGEVGRVLAGRDELWAKNRKKMIFLFFFFSNFSKQIFKRFSNPNLNLIKPLKPKI